MIDTVSVDEKDHVVLRKVITQADALLPGQRLEIFANLSQGREIHQGVTQGQILIFDAGDIHELNQNFVQALNIVPGFEKTSRCLGLTGPQVSSKTKRTSSLTMARGVISS